LIAAALTGCSTTTGATNDASGNTPKCVQPIVPGIDQGVAGVATYLSDIGNEPDMPASGRSVTVGGVTVKAGTDGHFAIALAPGDYMTGDANENVMVHVDAGMVVRADLEVSFESSWWLPTICAH
jgi:hypothetical protein